MTESAPRHGGGAEPHSSDEDDLSPSHWRDLTLFFRHWLRAPGTTGAMLPSSRAMARTMSAVLDDYRLPTVAELGPGTGPVTAVIQQRLRGQSTHVAVEIHEAFAQRLRARYPSVVVVNQSAARLQHILTEHDLEPLDVVISGLPFTTFSSALQTEILGAVAHSLRDNGVFATFRYLGASRFPAARRFRRHLDDHFEDVTVSRPIFGNVPPVRLLTARGPRLSRSR